MAITISQQPQTTHDNTIFTDDLFRNRLRFSSSLEHFTSDFLFRVEIKNNNTVIYNRYLQYGELDLYPILSNIETKAETSTEVELNQNNNYTIQDGPATSPINVQKFHIEIKIVETNTDSQGERQEYATQTLEYFAHKGKCPNQLYDDLMPSISFQNPVNLGAIIRTQVGLFGDQSAIIRAHGSTFDETEPYTNDQEFRTLGTNLSVDSSNPIIALFKAPSGTTEIPKKAMVYFYDDCVENHIVTWRNSVGLLQSYNFAHSGIRSGRVEEQRFQTNFAKRAITNTTNFVDVSTLYITEEVAKWLEEIYKSTEIYYNDYPVVPVDLAFTRESRRFSKLINMTIRLEFAQKENGILL